ncbi:MAG: GTPase Era [Geminocystis sp.]|nr:GTPase Era [Geminocystis sp.]HIK38119.1 GTPase Era [Geminocystis sp. M7585_C2015_104]MCS7148149.1 GTPase Era [Geminocystis sp.]MCX8078102.1 GTPase Era [Geminocystis sp.]MDW8116500.1 GTPase Era [Geminocystis sp.]
MTNRGENTVSSIPVAPPDFKSGFVAIIGRPNVGKSTLMNRLVGQKVAITSPVAQTTRNRLRGILTTEGAQIIFVDTPGIHKPHHELGRVLVQNAISVIDSVDLVLFVVDASQPAGPGDRYITEILQRTKTQVILGLNKTDLQGKDRDSLNESYRLLCNGKWPMVNFSAITGEGLDRLQEELIARLDYGPYYYPPDLVTDQPERFIIGELIREQILLHTREEIPHSVAVTVEKIEEDEKITKIYASIAVERDSQKGIIIGHKGNMLKQIGTAAREQIQALISGKVYLELFVKVEPKWRQSKQRLAEFGYRLED